MEILFSLSDDLLYLSLRLLIP